MSYDNHSFQLIIILLKHAFLPVLRIRDVNSESRIQGQKDSGSRIWIRIKEFTEWKYDRGCSSRIQIPDLDLDFQPSRIQDPGVKKAPDPGSGSATLIPSILIYAAIHSFKAKQFCSTVQSSMPFNSYTYWLPYSKFFAYYLLKIHLLEFSEITIY